MGSLPSGVRYAPCYAPPPASAPARQLARAFRTGTAWGSIKALGLMVGIMLLVTGFHFPANAPAAPAQAPGPEPCSTTNNAFLVGEQLVYKLYYNWNFVWLSAGEVTFNVRDMGKQYHISAVGRTYSSYEWFFKVRDRYDTYIDKQTMLPTVSIRDVKEGGFMFYDKVTFDRNRNVAVSVHGKTKEVAEAHEYKIDNCMHDVMSIIYLSRNFEYNGYSKGQKFPVKIFLDKEVHPLQVTYLGKDADLRVKGLGNYKTHKFSPQVVAGNVFKEGSQMVVWVTDDMNKIPVLIESPVSVGSVKAVLKSHKGLRYEMSAKLQ